MMTTKTITLDDIPDDAIVHIVELGVPACDRWLLPLVCRRFRRLFFRASSGSGGGRRRLRTLDDALERVIQGGGLATVRMLLSLSVGSGKKKKKKPPPRSCVWASGVEIAAARGDLEMVRLLNPFSSSPRESIVAALAGGHVDVAEFLWTATSGDDSTIIAMAAARSGSRASLEWVLSKPELARAARNNKSFPALLHALASAGDMPSVELFLDRSLSSDWMSTSLMRYMVSTDATLKIGSTDVGVIRLLHERLGIAADPSELVRMPDHHRALAQVEELAQAEGLAPDDFVSSIMSVPAHMTWDYHGYIRSTGRGGIVRVDLEQCLVRMALVCEDAVVSYWNRRRRWWSTDDQKRCEGGVSADVARRVKILVDELRSDPADVPPHVAYWALRCAPLQKSLVEFLRPKHFNIEIWPWDSPEASADHVRAMLAVGGTCDAWTFSAACNYSTVDVARLVWANMNGPARSGASNRTQRVVFYHVTDIAMLEFLDDEIGAGLSSHEISFERTTLTLAYASRLIDEERWARNAAWQVVQAAATFGHVDVVERFAPMCATAELEKLEKLFPVLFREAVRRCLSARRHPLSRFLRRLFRWQ